VNDVLALPPELVAEQIDAILSDIGADVVKTGMLANKQIIEVVVEKVQEHNCERLVVDPVMVASTGARLMEEDAVETIRSRLLPLATVVTPNLREAQVLLDRELTTWDAIRDAAKELVEGMGADAAIVKGGHAPSDESASAATDLFYDGEGFHEYTTARIDTNNIHGSGCTFASAIAAGLARGTDLRGSVAMAKSFVTKALQSSYSVGAGQGPLHHFFRFWQAGIYERAD